MRRRRERFDWRDWHEMRVRVHEEQDGKCSSCDRPLPLNGALFCRMHLAHLVPLGAGFSRHDPNAHRFVEGRKVMLNERENLVGLCKECHDIRDARA